MILVAGAGAIGQWLAARLQAAGKPVLALARPTHVAALANLTITGETRFEAAVPAVATVAEARETCPDGFEGIVVTCKAHQTASVAKAVAPLLAESGVVASLQNGFGNAAKLAHFVDADQVAVCLTSHGISVEEPGRLHHAGTGPTKVGAMPGSNANAARRVHAWFDAAGLDPSWMDDVAGHVWQKALVNSGINPVAAAHGLRNGELLEPARFAEAQALVEEGYALSRAAGVALPPGDCVEAMRATLERTRGNRCSMLQDVQAGRPTEIEQITGHLIRLGRRLGYPMFASEDAYRAVKRIEEAKLGAEAALALTRDEVAWEGRAEGTAF